MENTTKENQFVSDFGFKFYDADGFELTTALPSDVMLISAEIPAGKKVKGILVYDVPTQDGTWELHYTGMLGMTDDAIWDIPAQ